MAVLARMRGNNCTILTVCCLLSCCFIQLPGSVPSSVFERALSFYFRPRDISFRHRSAPRPGRHASTRITTCHMEYTIHISRGGNKKDYIVLSTLSFIDPFAMHRRHCRLWPIGTYLHAEGRTARACARRSVRPSVRPSHDASWGHYPYLRWSVGNWVKHSSEPLFRCVLASL